MNKIKCAVIGVGYLGRFHAQKYQALPHAELVAVCDMHQETANEVACEMQVQAFYDYKQLLPLVDAVSIAATTKAHYEIAKNCLEAGVHVLLEKPIAETLEQAEQLIHLARKHNAKFQIGHLERFNSATMALKEYLDRPLFIESQRIAPFKPRGTDVNVVLDLMIHDIDILRTIVDSPVTQIDAQGSPVLSNHIDIANARLHFENGCVANVTASRISFKSERKMRIFQPNSYLSVDFQHRKLAVFKKGEGEMFPGIPTIAREEASFENTDALLEEIKAFLHAIATDASPVVSGEDGAAALAIAEQITQKIQSHLHSYS